MFGGVSGSGSSGRRGSGTGRPSGNTRRGDAGTGSSGASGSTSGGRLFCFFFFCFCFFFLFCFFRFGLTSIDVHLSVRDLPIRRQTNTGVVRGSGASYHHRLLWDAVKEGNTALVESLVAQEPEAVHIVDSVRGRPSDRRRCCCCWGGEAKRRQKGEACRVLLLHFSCGFSKTTIACRLDWFGPTKHPPLPTPNRSLAGVSFTVRRTAATWMCLRSWWKSTSATSTPRRRTGAIPVAVRLRVQSVHAFPPPIFTVPASRVSFTFCLFLWRSG